jgi:hypothetical protein
LATTVSILNIEETTKTVVVPFIDRADWTEIDSFLSEDGLNRRKVYQLSTGDIESPATLRVSVYKNPGKGAQIGNVVLTVKIETIVTKIDDTSGEVLVHEPASVSITTTMPGASAVPDVDDFIALVSNAYSCFFHDVDGSNIPVTDVVDQMKYNIATVMS